VAPTLLSDCFFSPFPFWFFTEGLAVHCWSERPFGVEQNDIFHILDTHQDLKSETAFFDIIDPLEIACTIFLPLFSTSTGELLVFGHLVSPPFFSFLPTPRFWRTLSMFVGPMNPPVKFDFILAIFLVSPGLLLLQILLD